MWGIIEGTGGETPSTIFEYKSRDIYIALILQHFIQFQFILQHFLLLTGRQQYTTIAHLKSDLCSINYGVPQGSMLRPILFLLHINDLNQTTVHS